MRLALRRSGAITIVCLVSTAVGDWHEVSYHFAEGEANLVQGPGKAFKRARPNSGEWKASFDVSNHVANLTGEPIRGYSARAVGFHDYNTVSGHADQSGHIVFKIQFSEPVTAAVWDIGPHGRNIVAPARLLEGRWQEHATSCRTDPTCSMGRRPVIATRILNQTRPLSPARGREAGGEGGQRLHRT